MNYIYDRKLDLRRDELPARVVDDDAILNGVTTITSLLYINSNTNTRVRLVRG